MVPRLFDQDTDKMSSEKRDGLQEGGERPTPWNDSTCNGGRKIDRPKLAAQYGEEGDNLSL